MLKNVYLAGGVRTPFGSLNGSLSNLTAPQLGSVAIKGTLERAKIKPGDVDEVIFGNVISAGIGQNVARQAALGAGLPNSVPATTVHKVCGSAMRAVIMASQAIQCDDAQLVVAGGTESMSNAPYLLRHARSGYRMGHGELIDAMIHDGLWDVYTNRHMGECGDQCADQYKISREDQDKYAAESYQRAIQCWQSGFYKGEVIPVEIETGKGKIVVDKDEDVAKFQGEEKLRSLRPAFGPNSKITAGNASGINDGAASMVVFGDKAKDRLKLKPTARILGWAGAAMEPDWFTIAPVYAVKNLCEKTSLKLSNVDFFEVNEAFALVALHAIRELGLDRNKVNVAGGAVAIGHPIGATGARIINTLVRALEHHNKKTGIAAICLGGGEALALAVERCA